jgi:hypothetical protein
MGILLGAVAYDPKVVTIWDGFARFFAERGLAFDYILYTAYERQVAAHLAGDINVAWNSPLAWLQARAAAEARGREAHPLVMRDTDRDLTSVVVVRADSPARSLADLAGKRVGVGAADEARHIEVFTRRASLRSPLLGTSTASGQASLATLLHEPDFALATFLLSVLGEGSFLSLLRFLAEHGDPLTRAVTRLAAQDEARHVAFGMSHVQHRLGVDPGLRGRLVAAVERRHDALQHTAGLNADVFDSLVVVAAGSYAPAALARGWDAVARLVAEMDHGRRVRLAALGFGDGDAERLSALHTRNFM